MIGKARRTSSADGPTPAPTMNPSAGKRTAVARRYGTPGAAIQRKASKEYPNAGELTAKDDSARFDDDTELEKVESGGDEVGRGGRGLTVTKIQQALIDIGYLLPKYGVDGKFEGETAKTRRPTSTTGACSKARPRRPRTAPMRSTARMPWVRR